MSFWAQREIAAIVLIGGIVLAVAAWFGEDPRWPGQPKSRARAAFVGGVILVTGALFLAVDPR